MNNPTILSSMDSRSQLFHEEATVEAWLFAIDDFDRILRTVFNRRKYYSHRSISFGNCVIEQPVTVYNHAEISCLLRGKNRVHRRLIASPRIDSGIFHRMEIDRSTIVGRDLSRYSRVNGRCSMTNEMNGNEESGDGARIDRGFFFRVFESRETIRAARKETVAR